uniref:Uncharacterized protein n=1 Tax=Stegastes partitus TaxID=144197 RepID=A0A3B5AZF9_9TELE
MQQKVSEQERPSPLPFLLPLSSLSSHNTTNPIIPCSDTVVKPSYFLLQMMWAPPPPPSTTSQPAPGNQQPLAPMKECLLSSAGRSRPHRGLKRSRQERHSKDATKLLLLYDENILDNDPHRESKDVAFAQSYLNRVRDALQDVPGQMEEFVSLLNEFEQVGEGEELLLLYRKLRCILGNRMDLLRDFAAFLHPEQALQCGLVSCTGV